MRTRHSSVHSSALWLFALAATCTFAVACGEDDDSDDSGSSNTTSSNTTADTATFGTDADVTQAQAIFAEVGGTYSTWELFPGTVMGQASMAPHANTANIYVSSGFSADSPAIGATVIKENINEAGDVEWLTVMRRIEGYDPDNNDWFWMKISTTGDLDMNGEGRALAGAIGKGGAMGCVPCHGGAGGGDYFFSND